MPWFKVDDGLSSSLKTTRIPRARRAAAMGLWVLAGSWSARELTDGFIPAHMVDELACTIESAEDLVAAEYWSTAEGGWQMADWAVDQPTRAETEEKRRKNAEKVAAWRQNRQRGNQPGSNPVTDAGTNQVANPAPVPVPVPDPSQEEIPTESLSSDAAVAPPRPEIDGLLDLLDSELIRNGSKPPSRTQRNRDAVRLMLDRDGRTVEQIENAIRWCQADSFWRSNILSAAKLREKYDQLRLAAQREQKPQTPGRLTPEQRARKTFAALNDDGALSIDPPREIDR